MRVSRRGFVKVAGMAGALWSCRSPRLLWSASPATPQAPCLVHSGSGFAPFIEPFLKQIQPGQDEFVGERYAYELQDLLDRWAAALQSGGDRLHAPRQWLAATLEASPLDYPTVQTLRTGPPLESEKLVFPVATNLSSTKFLAALEHSLAPLTHIEISDLQIDAIEIAANAPTNLRTRVHYDLTGRLDGNRREQRTGEWNIHWQQQGAGQWCVTHWSAAPEMRCRLTGPGFADVTAAALGQNDSYREQLLPGVDHWRKVLDGACGIDIYGNNGVCIGDFDGDGLDDIYICQPAGLPNRLYKNRGDGTFEDVTQKAGVGVLDGTACALFADLTNSGRQDLIVVRVSGPLLFVNRGDGAFELKPDAFQFAHPPQGSFTGASVADYNRDGLLDIYFCTYSFYQGLSDYEYPNPFYDAQNGPPNFLMRNSGGHSFEDVTASSGMNASNNRFSFDAVWNDYDHDGWPDLYVVNDFGRKVLYRNNRNGTFTDVSAAAGVEDPGEGMSMTWLDYDNDGWDDLYVVNMWESAGRRVTRQPQFMPNATDAIRSLFRRDAKGNSMLHNEGTGGAFRDVTGTSGTEFGGWNWGSDAWDFDHDGYPDLYIANGFISGEIHEDLSSLYWRHVAARSLDAGGHAQRYADAWSAINEFIRCGYTWSGYQRNNFYLNNRNATFSEAASLLGLCCMQDSRSFALGDLDGDGRIEVVLKNRNAPQVRIFHNRLSPLGASVAFSLRGTKSNRDAIGAVVELESARGKQSLTLRAGSGFLSQNAKTVHLGLGENPGPLRAIIHWPSGTRQALDNLPANHRISIVEGESGFHATAFKSSPWAHSTDERTDTHEHSSAYNGTWMLDPIRIPSPTLKDTTGAPHPLTDWTGRAQLLVFVSPSCGNSAQFLAELTRGKAEWTQAGIAVVAIAMNAGEGPGTLTAHPGIPLLIADEKASKTFNLFRRYLFDFRRNMPLPSAFLLNGNGEVARVYEGPVTTAEFIADSNRIPQSAEERLKQGLPFPGRYFGASLHHNDFTYGVAYLQYEDYDEAQTSFEKSLERDPGNATAYYDLGMIALYKGQPAQARVRLQRAVELDPNNADAWNNLGVAMGQLGDHDQARLDFRHALRLQPALPIAVKNMISVLRYLNKPQEARDVLTKAIQADPQHAEWHSQLGMILLGMGSLDDALAELQKAVDLEPSDSEMLNALGVAQMQKGETASATQTFQESARLAPTYAAPVLNLAVLYLSSGQQARARELLSGFLRRNPENKDVREALKEVESRQ